MEKVSGSEDEVRSTSDQGDELGSPTKTDLRLIEDVDRKATSHMDEHSGLKRTVGLKSVIALNLASMLGSCLLLPGIANSLTGSSAFVSIFVSGLAVLPAAFSKAELSTAMPHSGGAYIYLARAFGPLLGAITGIGLWFDLLFQAIFGLRGSTEYIKVLLGDVDEVWLKVIGVFLLIAVLCLNLSGMTWIKTVTKWYTLMIMIVLMAVALASLGAKESNSGNFEANFMTEGVFGFFTTVAYVHMGYGGLTKICALASEVKDPGTNLPKGMLISLFVMVVWFSTVTGVMASIMGDMTKTDYSPFETIGKIAVNDGMGKFTAFICVIGMASMGNVSLLAVSRFPFAMARDGLVPLQFEAIWHRTSAPWFSLCFCSVAIAIAIVTLPIDKIVKLASSFKILVFIACNIALIVFRSKQPEWYKPAFSSPLYPYIQIFGIIVGIFLLTLMNIEGAIAAFVIVLIGIVAYLVYGRYYAKFMGVLKPEVHLNLVPYAWIEQQKRGALEARTSSFEVVAFMIHDPNFLADWRTWTHEEILFWFAHHDESRYAGYIEALGTTVPKLMESGEDLKDMNNLVLKILGITDSDDRAQIIQDINELLILEQPDDIIALGTSDMCTIEKKDFMNRMKIRVGSRSALQDIDFGTKSETAEMTKIEDKAGTNI